MSVYLHDIPLSDAKAAFEAALRSAGRWGLLGDELIPLDEFAVGRVLSEPVWARISSPHYHASAMDGFAVRAVETEEATLPEPVLLSCDPSSLQAAYVDTGDPLPVWADAVIPIENIEPLDGDQLAGNPRTPSVIRIRSAVTPWSHVRAMGEDIVATQLVLPAGHTLRPVDLGAIAACGHFQIKVACKPRVAIIPTGTELVPIGQPVKAGKIIEFNSIVLAGQVNLWGGLATRFPIVPDNFVKILEAVQLAAKDHDLVLLNAGSSAGSEDFSASVVEELGTLLVHGVAVCPGHPVILGMLNVTGGSGIDKVPVIGVPGYPVSAALTGEIFVEPLISLWQGKPAFQPDIVEATLTRKITSPAGDDDYMRVVVGRVNEKLLAAPLSRGSGVITSLVRADGIAILPRGTQGLPAGAPLPVRLYRSRTDLERTIFAIGSHDLTLDLLAQFLATHDRRLVSANVGSQGGLVALRRGEAHLAGSHLLDPATGEYNHKYIREYLPGQPVKVISLVGRQQGLLVLPGNPKGIHHLSDLARPEISFVNRQRGAGTRVLLDYALDLLGIAPENIRGYNQEEYTHLAVAAAVASGRADCGLGIAAAAKALELDFIPLYEEKYELIIPAENYTSELLAPLLEILHSPVFHSAVAAMPGYEIGGMGNIVAEIG